MVDGGFEGGRGKSYTDLEGAGKSKVALEEGHFFQDRVNSALVTTILDHIVIKKGSTREEVHFGSFLSGEIPPCASPVSKSGAGALFEPP